MIISTLNLILFIVTVWLSISVLYMFFYSVTGFFYNNKNRIHYKNLPEIAVFIPSYKEDDVIIEVVREALLQDYKGNYDVIVIADSLKSETINELLSLPIKLIEVDFEKSTKAKALNSAMARIKKQYDMALVLDADNIMEHNALTIFGSEYLNGSLATQGHRCAKNQETQIALLDGISEEVNNHIYCKGPSAVNLSSRLVGSGMAFDYSLFKSLMKDINAIGGFDKELELKIIKEKIKINYNHTAIIYDEKVAKSEVFEQQRKRWISAQYHYMLKSMPGAFIELFNGNFDYFYKALQLTFPPRLILPVILFLFSGLFFIIDLSYYSKIWFILFLLNVLAYSLSIPSKYWNKNLLYGAIAIPKTFIITLRALVSIKGANKKFIHTPHG